jgi:hypothetical protein
MQVFTKTATQAPIDVVNDWYNKLPPEQQNNCEIQEADEPIEYSSNGQPSNFEAPHRTPHKTRYKIGIKQAIVKKIESQYDGLPSGQHYDYLCGNIVGSQLTSASPYLEFDDRTPDKYLFVSSLGNDGSILIDLNSIRF